MHAAKDSPTIDVSERGADRDGEPQRSSRRLFMQLLAFDCRDGASSALERLCSELGARGARAVVYEDLNHPRGLGLLGYGEDPADLVTLIRPAVAAVTSLEPRPELTMLGRSYSTGYESDLNYWLLERPQQTVQNPAWPWAVWYPLRRTGAFERLEPRERGGILREHATIGRAYGEQDLAHDVRLACHGLDANDNEFVIGLVGKELHPLSHVVQSMRGTRQTSEFMAHMGPFFVGRVAWQSHPQPA